MHSTIHYTPETTQLQTHRWSIFLTESDEANYEQDSTQQFQTSLRRYTALSLFL